MVFFHLQTVFEGFGVNTPPKGVAKARSLGIKVPVGYDARIDGDRVSITMRRYGTGGTPWTVVIDKKGIIRYSGFTPDPATGELSKLIAKLRSE